MFFTSLRRPKRNGPRPRRGRFRSFRCGTSSSSRTWSCPSSSVARSPSARSKRRWRHDKEILLAAQKKAKTNDPSPEDIYTVGTVGTIVQLLRLPDGTVKVLVEGKRRARIKRFVPNDEFFLVRARRPSRTRSGPVELEALARSVQSTFEAT
jgi:ATP-dependent Lon protease